MNDSRDPYNTPPAPERFDPPAPENEMPAAPVSAERPYERRELGHDGDSARYASYEHTRKAEPVAADPPPGGEERVPLGGGVLEPLPAVVGDFAARPTEMAASMPR
jgi:hypothetical protein